MRIPLLVVLAFSLSAVADTVWLVEDGWLTACDGGVVLFSTRAGRSCDLDFCGIAPAFPVQPVTTHQPEGAWQCEYAATSGTLIDRYEPFSALGSDAWLRTLTYTNGSQQTQDIVGATLRVSPAISAGTPVWNPQHFWMGEVSPGLAACVAYRGSTDYYRIDADPHGYPSHHVDSCWRLAPGQTATIGAQGIWLGTARADGFRREAQRWFDAIGLRVPSPPDWLADAILYECSAGGHIDSRFSDVGGFDRLARQAQYLAELGVTAVWLQGVEQHKSPGRADQGGWNLYDPIDFDRVDSILGGPEALKRLTDAFRKEGIHVLGELVPHGGRSVQATALEAWWTRQRDGSLQRNWGGYGMDYSSPEWQAVMARHSTMLARDFGMEGARIDVADASGPNWGAPGRNHASYSTLAGSVEMLKAIGAGFQQGNPALTLPLLIPENVNTLEHFAVSPIAYGHSGWMMFARDLTRMVDDPPMMVASVQAFFENERGAYPAGALVLRTLNNHDTVCDSGRVQFRYGAGLARALYGVCLMVPGLPMMYQEEEIGSFDALRVLNRARQRIPEFGRGEVDYCAVQFHPSVFACLRTHAGTHAIGLSNLAGYGVEGLVRVPLEDGVEVYDAVSGRSAAVHDGAFRWRMDAYATALIRAGKRPDGTLPDSRVLPSSGSWLEDASLPSMEALERAPSSKLPLEGGTRAVGGTQERPVDAKAHGLKIVPMECGWRICAGRLDADLRAGSGPWHETMPSHYESADGRAEICTTNGSIRINCTVNVGEKAPVIECVIHNACKWYVSGRTALLSDFAMRRHFPFPAETGYVWTRDMPWMSSDFYNHVAPTGRLWQSLLEPLHPDQPAMAFDDAGEVSLVVSAITTNAANVVLTDRTDESCDERYGLALRFYGTDPDLSPRVAAFGLGQPWTMDSYALPSRRPLQMSMTLSSNEHDMAMTELKAERRPVQRGADVHVDAPGHRQGADGIWLPTPGAVTWSNLAEVPGYYRIRLELRHSEASREGTDLDDAYEVRLNGTVLPLEWIKRDTFHTGNAFFGYALTARIDLSKQPLRLTIRTSKPWCAIRQGFHLERAAR